MKHGLPAGYNETYLRLLMRDPGEIFAFWEFSPEAFTTAGKKAAKEGSGFRPVLRLFMVDSLPHDRGLAIADFLLEEGEDSRYIPVPEQGRHYRLEYGFAADSGSVYCDMFIERTPDAGFKQHQAPVPPEPGVEQRTAAKFDTHPDTLPCKGVSPSSDNFRVLSCDSPADALTWLVGSSVQCIPSPASEDFGLCDNSTVW